MFVFFVKGGRGLNYEVALFPLNDPLTPTTLEGHALVLRTACGLFLENSDKF